MTETRVSLGKLLGDLHEERVQTWDPAALQVNIDQRATLVEAARTTRFVKAGDRVEDFSLAEVDGSRLTLTGLTQHGPVALIFFRFATCPACNIALPYYAHALWPELNDLGVRLVAVSPQTPDRLVEIKRKHDLPFEVSSDAGNELAGRFGILYEFDEASKKAALSGGRFIGDVTGTGTWELPQPAVVVIDSHHVVRFADVSPDWLARTEAETVLAVVRPLVLEKAA